MSASPKFEGMKLQRDLARANVEQLRAERDAALARANAWETDWGVERARAEKAEADRDKAIEAQVRASMFPADLMAQLVSAQAVIDAAQEFYARFERMRHYPDEEPLAAKARAALAAHLSRYPPKGVT